MGAQPSKHHISVGLLAHVRASKRESHLDSYIPGSKTGDVSYSAGAELSQGIKCHHMLWFYSYRDRSIWWLIF